MPIMLDRSKQALAKMALEPEWEARFENNSYGFRPGRSTHDAIEAIFTIICMDYPPRDFIVHATS
jgi:RNA-directed DNA polymerase